MKFVLLILFSLFLISFTFAGSVPGIYATDINNDLWRCTQERCVEVATGNFSGLSIQSDPTGGIYVLDRNLIIKNHGGKEYVAGSLWHCNENGCNLISDEKEFRWNYSVLNNGKAFVISYFDKEVWVCDGGGCTLLSDATQYSGGCFLKSEENNFSVILMDEGYDLWKCISVGSINQCTEIYVGDSSCSDDGGFRWSESTPNELVVANQSKSGSPSASLYRVQVGGYAWNSHSANYINLLKGGYFMTQDGGVSEELWHIDGPSKRRINIFASGVHNFGASDSVGGMFVCSYPDGIWHCSLTGCVKISDQDCPAEKPFSDNLGGAFLVDNVVFHCTSTTCNQIGTFFSGASSIDDVVDSLGNLFVDDSSSSLWKCSSTSCSKLASGGISVHAGIVALDNLGGIFALKSGLPVYCSDTGCVTLDTETFYSYSLKYQVQEEILSPPIPLPPVVNSIVDFEGTLRSSNFKAQLVNLCLYDEPNAKITFFNDGNLDPVLGPIDINCDSKSTIEEIDLTSLEEKIYLVELDITQGDKNCIVCKRRIYLAVTKNKEQMIPDNNIFSVAFIILAVGLIIKLKRK
jgi:hypothetical protein